jgi:hypothetical protein
MKKMKKGTHLGTLIPVVNKFEDLIIMINKDAEVLGKEIEEILKSCNLRIPYDREVLMMLMANLSAAAVSSVENFDRSYTSYFKTLYEFHLEQYRLMKGKE